MAVLGFPHPVNETSARVVAGGVVAMTTTTVVANKPWLMVPLVYGFAARVLTGPKLSPLGQLATKVVTPRINRRHRFVPGPPKRFAQGMGAVMTGAAALLALGFGLDGAADALLVAMIVAAGLESIFALCLGCEVFALLMRAGLVPRDVCAECANLSSRPGLSRPGS